jgi:ribosomal protein L32
MALKLPPHLRRKVDAAVERIPDLEVTSSVPLGDVGIEAVPGLEPTVAAPTPDQMPEYVPGFEPTADELIDLPGEDDVVPDLERTVEEFEYTPILDDEYPQVCPHCGFHQTSGRICNNCGLSRVTTLRAPATPGPAATTEGDRVRCRACGALVMRAALCSDCGQPLPAAE